MAKEKKRLSKNAKAAANLLKDSKLLEIAKKANDANTNTNFNSTEISLKTSAPNKPRPEKKRG